MAFQLTDRQNKIMVLVAEQDHISISQIKDQLQEDISQATLNRDLAHLVDKNCLDRIGKGRGITYVFSGFYRLFAPLDTTVYFDLDPDKRVRTNTFNQEVFSVFSQTSVFTPQEIPLLDALKSEYQNNVKTISPVLYQKELERLSIELSWKSAQIEGNTYSLLETERLFLEKEEASNKSKEEATMLLNHKDALNYLLKHKDLAKNLDLRLIEEVHSLLIKDLGVGKNIRSRMVGITGTAYKPLDNDFQIREALENMCALINAKDNGFEKALLAIVLISYIQPFEDGNKRTGRMIGNALLISDNACPLSYRSVDSLDYKKAMLLFYEQNNLAQFKDLFIDQINFAVKNYFG